jgi:hypothetical protein
MEVLRRELAGIRQSIIAAIVIAIAVAGWAKLNSLPGPIIFVLFLAAFTLLLVLRQHILQLWKPKVDEGPLTPDKWAAIIREWLAERDCVTQTVNDPTSFFNIRTSLDKGPNIAVAMTRDRSESIHFGAELTLEQDLMEEVLKASPEQRTMAFGKITLELLKLGADLSNINPTGVRISVTYLHGDRPDRYTFLKNYFDMRRYLGIAMISYQVEFQGMANQK